MPKQSKLSQYVKLLAGQVLVLSVALNDIPVAPHSITANAISWFWLNVTLPFDEQTSEVGQSAWPPKYCHVPLPAHPFKR